MGRSIEASNRSDSNDGGRMGVVRWEEHVAVLQEACDALGIGRGRAGKLTRLIGEFFEETKWSRDHGLAANESFEITDIYRLWRPHWDRFPGLKERIAKCLRKGPVVAEQERPGAASNRPRNQAFVYFLAGRLIWAGVEVMAVDGIPPDVSHGGRPPDVLLDWKGERIVVECKRPQGPRSVNSCVRRGASQIRERGAPGIVALDCSRVIRPMSTEGSALYTRSPVAALRHLEACLLQLLDTIPKPSPDSRVLGIELIARVPTVEARESTVVSPTGGAYTLLRPVSIYPEVVWYDTRVPGSDAVAEIWHQVATRVAAGDQWPMATRARCEEA